MEYLLLIVGFVLLIKGADTLVDGAGSIAKKYGISNLVIGLTIVAFGTSAPELVVSLMSGFSGNADLAISNVLGSNISNILLILGITGLLYPLKMPHSTVKKELPFAILTIVILFIILSDRILGLNSENIITRLDAFILTIFFGLFLFYTFKTSKNKNDEELLEEEIVVKSFGKSVLFIVLGLIGLIFGGNLIVDNAILIAQSYGLPNSFIGVTIVAIGTSLPELATSIMAALKKNTDMAIGGIVGSNIFNTLWILGATGLILPLKAYEGVELDLIINLAATTIILLFAFLPRKYFIERRDGAVLLFMYIAYISMLISKL